MAMIDESPRNNSNKMMKKNSYGFAGNNICRVAMLINLVCLRRYGKTRIDHFVFDSVDETFSLM